MPLTRRQKEILTFLSTYLRENGYSPSMEEIATHFKMASLNGVYKHLKALQERGFISRLSNQARSIQILNPQEGHRASPELPLVGTVAAGQPIEAISDLEYVSVPDSFLTRGRNFCLRVEGDSMIEEHIQDGDLIVVEEHSTAHNGQMVVALVDDEKVTLKKFFREGGDIRLQPANAELDPIVVSEERVQVQGIVVGVMRRY